METRDPTFHLGEAANPVALALNNYLPRLRPGRYKAAVLGHKLVLTAKGPMGSTYGYEDPPQYAISNTIEIEVVPATEAWIRKTIAESEAILRGPQPVTGQNYERRREAADRIRFLDVPASWGASLALLPAETYSLLRGLAATRQPARVCALMQAAIARPSQRVSSEYLYAMGSLCGRAKTPVPPAQAAAALAASLARKQPEPKTTAFAALMQRVQQVRGDNPPQPDPDWLPAVKNEFIKAYPTLDAQEKRSLLGLYTSTLRSPDMIPLLEAAMDAWKPGDYYEAPREALLNLYSIDPARAQARIRAELAREKTWLDPSELEMLPPAAARVTDDALIAALAAAQRPGGWNPELRMTAIAKYASPKALPRIQAVFESQQDQCQPLLMAYFLRVDPGYADRVFHPQPWDMHAPAPPCAARYFEGTPPLAMGPPLERYMVAYLVHPDARLKIAAAKSLGRYGSAAAAAPLWEAFHYFHDYWKGKEPELTKIGYPFLELELRNALARGTHWLTNEADLRLIESLCISGQCRYETAQDLPAWRTPLTIQVSSNGHGFRAQVAQYYGIQSMEALEEKLGQFPKGTQFILAGGGQALVQVRKYAAERGLIVLDRR